LKIFSGLLLKESEFFLQPTFCSPTPAVEGSLEDHEAPQAMPAKVGSGVFSIPNRTHGNPVQRSRQHVPTNLGVRAARSSDKLRCVCTKSRMIVRKNDPFGVLLFKECSSQGFRSVILPKECCPSRRYPPTGRLDVWTITPPADVHRKSPETTN
jgi:hypothetical protein